MFAGSTHFGAYLRALRVARRLTLDDVERLTADDPEPVTRSLLSRLENGKARVSALKMLALARVYRVGVGSIAEQLELAHAVARARRLGDGASRLERIGKALEAGEAGHLREALLLYESGLAAERRDGGPVEARLALARALLAAGRARLARELLADLPLERLEPPDRARALGLLAAASLATGRTLLATGLARCLDELPRPLPADVEVELAIVKAQVASRTGGPEPAFEAWIAAAGAARQAGESAAEIRCLVALAAVERRRGRPGEALFWCRKALRTAEQRSDHRNRARALIEFGRVHAEQGRTASARRLWAEARRLARELGLREELFEVYVELWRLAERESDAPAARSCLRSLRHLARQIERIPVEAPELERRLAAPAPSRRVTA